jgi:4-diphosphocytidyl-2C-methyl-D-erythritol kinase
VGQLSVTARVPAKINLHLGVGPVRPDGYHELHTVYHAVSLYDEVTIESTDDGELRVQVVIVERNPVGVLSDHLHP